MPMIARSYRAFIHEPCLGIMRMSNSGREKNPASYRPVFALVHTSTPHIDNVREGTITSADPTAADGRVFCVELGIIHRVNETE